MTRDMNIRIFRDTEHMYKTHKVLKNAVNESIKNQVLILENADVALADSKELEGKVLVSSCKPPPSACHGPLQARPNT